MGGGHGRASLVLGGVKRSDDAISGLYRRANRQHFAHYAGAIRYAVTKVADHAGLAVVETFAVL